VSERLASRATAVTIPMRGGTESLNAAAAAAVLLFEATRHAEAGAPLDGRRPRQ
jgi:tRNA G18 (ribose-2'-O)-methylase SpoU